MLGDTCLQETVLQRLLFSRSPTSVYSFRSMLLEHGSFASTGATTYACSGLYVLGTPGAGTAQAHHTHMKLFK